jgi:TonB family protein
MLRPNRISRYSGVFPVRKAIIVSVLLHLSLFGYLIIGGHRSQAEAYPKITMVDLVSLPPMAKGVEGGSEDFGRPQQTKPKTKVAEPPQASHMTEVQPNKKPARQQKPQDTPKAGKPAESRDKPGLPQGLNYGSEFGDVSVEGGQFETPTYLNILFAKIKNRWDNPFQGSDKIACVIYFTIEKGGAISDATIEMSSGIAAFDQSALRAVLNASPPPLPLEYSGTQLGIHLQFQFLP